MTVAETQELVFVCPFHGRLNSKDVSDSRTCLQCSRERHVSAAAATPVSQIAYTGHAPRHQYDCTRCKFAWCCGPLCDCVLTYLPAPPRARAKEVAEGLMWWRRSRASVKQ